MAMCFQNSRSTSCRRDGASGDFIPERSVNCCNHAGGLPVGHLYDQGLLRPIEYGQYAAIAYIERLADHGIEPSVGTVGDFYNNAHAELVNRRYKIEQIYSQPAWQC